MDGESADLIDLGDLIELDATFESAIDADSAAEELGYSEETLDILGDSDHETLRFLNPDVNSNGVFDREEGVSWYMEFFLPLRISTDQYILSANCVSVPVSILTDATYELIFDVSGVPPVESSITIVLPEDTMFVDEYGNVISTMV